MSALARISALLRSRHSHCAEATRPGDHGKALARARTGLSIPTASCQALEPRMMLTDCYSVFVRPSPDAPSQCIIWICSNMEDTPPDQESDDDCPPKEDPREDNPDANGDDPVDPQYVATSNPVNVYSGAPILKSQDIVTRSFGKA